jgi:hypothetical protein
LPLKNSLSQNNNSCISASSEKQQKTSESALIIALSYFPELDDIRIELREKKIKTTMNARPSISSTILRVKTKRKYLIRINNFQGTNRILTHTIPDNALTGLYGHELCHIIDYIDKGRLKMIFTGINYINRRGKAGLEKKIDSMTIARGLGWELHAWADFVLTSPDASDKYKSFKKTTYLQPFEIEAYIRADSSYSNYLPERSFIQGIPD